MTEQEKNNDNVETEFAFVILKGKDGRLAVGNVEGNPPAARQPSLDDIYASLCIIKRDLETQNQVGAFVQILGQNAEQQQSGLVVPNSAEPVKRFKKVAR